MPGAPRRVAVLGAGAVGTLLGGLLASSGAEVILVDPRVAPDAGDEVVIHEPDGRRVAARVGRAAAPAALAGAPDLAVLAVKTFDLAAALDDLRAWPGTPVLTIQNGVGAEDLVAAARPGVGHVAGSLTAPVERVGANEVRWRGRGGIALAPVAGAVDHLVEELVGIFTVAGLPARRLGDARAMKWSKLVVNLVGQRALRAGRPRPGGDLRRPGALRPGAPTAARGARRHAGAGDPRRRAAGRERAPPRPRRPASRAPLPAHPGPRGRRGASREVAVAAAPPPGRGAGAVGGRLAQRRRIARTGALLGVPTPVNDALAVLVDAATVDPELAASLAAEPARVVDLVSALAASAAALTTGRTPCRRSRSRSATRTGSTFGRSGSSCAPAAGPGPR